MKPILNRSQAFIAISMVFGAVVVMVIGSLFFPATSSAALDIIDLSHDKCQANHAESSVGHHQLGIVGVNGGADWQQNPCLGDEIKHFDAYALYVNTNYPSDQCPTQATRTNAYNCGYNLGLWDVRYASSQGAHSSVWWIDVETGPGIPWSGHDSINSSFLYGLQKALEDRGAEAVGYYSTGLQWNSITGGWHNNNFAWYATGSIGPPQSSVVRSACSGNFTGGQVFYYQYIIGSFDHDALC